MTCYISQCLSFHFLICFKSSIGHEFELKEKNLSLEIQCINKIKYYIIKEIFNTSYQRVDSKVKLRESKEPG